MADFSEQKRGKALKAFHSAKTIRKFQTAEYEKGKILSFNFSYVNFP